ncbi:hypothetical protein FVEN_g4151 [Fusarium venenatum]|uniref:Ubiquitin interaction domain-containing protein n=1 Tax=Fusarium venenatum TaxID=56646 RepID=A0A2L2TDM6_9HYPO|nr:uncharacterized protein FVRRES_09159 [Fusarium venenatum]KAG8358358.1 hypothetical protein FVEN_g4151 [Fusarium venenatum]KAH6965859.1 hypothetical protein EDB82DRAFT_529570 [Fusarium venenatum]CEI69082.1 unnamed protein product [Fusarium venenatum]
MASMDPSEAEVDMVIDFCGLQAENDRHLAIQALKLNNRDTNKVIGQFYEGEENFRSRYQKLWDDSVFSADRDGSTNNAGISFHVESTDHSVIQGVTPPPESHIYGAPSRPPSRSNNRSPLGTMVDWTAAHVPGVPNSQAQEDDDMQRALFESAQEAGVPVPQQETGLTGTSEPAPIQFGPANRESYNTADWAMVPTGPASKKTSVDVPLASKRKRAPGAPAMLVVAGAPDHDHRLGGLLTIMHEISIARNILLNIGDLAATYNYNKGWWKGEEVLSPDLLTRMQQDGNLNGSKSDIGFQEEIHRLMAFLDSTERGHGSIVVLADYMHPESSGMEKQFYEMLGQRHIETIRPIMQVASLALFHGDTLEEDATFGLLEIEHTHDEYKCIKTLYEALDHVMWSDTLGSETINQDSKVAFFKEMGEVLVLDIAGDGPKDPIEIPQEFYPEKYMMSRKDEARRIQYGWRQTKKEMARLEKKKEQLDRLAETWVTDEAKTKSDLLKRSAEQWEGYKSYLDGLGKFRALEKSGFDTNKYPDYHQAVPDRDDVAKEQYQTVEEVIQHSKKLLESLDKRMKDIDTEMEQVAGKQRALGRLLTVPDKPGRPEPMTCKKYLLRGVATSPHIIYVCRREEEDLIEMDGDESKPADQWWRLAYTPYGDQSATRAEKLDIEQVLKQMWDDTNKPLLVYATEEALKAPKQPLPPQLERFVKVDNKAFRQELDEEESTVEVKTTPTFDPISPSKRKHRADSVGSMDSNRASIGSDGRNGWDNPFDDQDDGIVTEMKDYGDSSDYIHSSDLLDDDPPTLPARPEASIASTTEPTSATLTPNTVGADYTDSALSVSEEPRSPEMQEKSKLPSFMSMSRPPSERKESANLIDIDMDMSDEKHETS